jgi:hypothetical protein
MGRQPLALQPALLDSRHKNTRCGILSNRQKQGVVKQHRWRRQRPRKGSPPAGQNFCKTEQFVTELFLFTLEQISFPVRYYGIQLKLGIDFSQL